MLDHIDNQSINNQSINNQLISDEHSEQNYVFKLAKRTVGTIAVGIGAPTLIVGGPFIGIGINMANMGVCFVMTPVVGSFEYIATGKLDYTKNYLHESIHLNEKLINLYWHLRNEIQEALNNA